MKRKSTSPIIALLVLAFAGQTLSADEKADLTAEVNEASATLVKKDEGLKDIMEKAAEWGGLTRRERDAIIQGTHEKIIEKYKKLTDDYYEMISKKGSDQR